MRRRSTFPSLYMIEKLSSHRIRLFFATGKVSEVAFPDHPTEKARIVYGGVGLDLGDGYELSAVTLHDRPGKVWQPGSRRIKHRTQHVKKSLP